MDATCFDSGNFLVQKISSGSGISTFITPFWETLEGTLVKIWSIKSEVLKVTQIRDFIAKNNISVVMKYVYAECSKSISFFSVSIFSKIMFKISRKLAWLSGLYITVVLCNRISKNIFWVNNMTPNIASNTSTILFPVKLK